MMRWLSVALVLLGSPALAEPIVGSLLAVHDGDTLTLSTGEKIRIFGIDAPELNQQCQRNGACVPCGYEARDKLMSLAAGELICEWRGTSYNRIVARCAAGGVDLARAMVETGQAVVYERYLKKRDPLKAIYLDAEARARAAAVGIWAGAFMPPDEWRNRKARLECER